MDKIRLKNMTFYGYHGTHEQEKILGGKFEVDLEFAFDLTSAIKSDQLEDTISYVDIYKLIQQIMTNSKYHLIESLAGNIIKSIFQKFPIDKATIKIRKPHVHIQGVIDTVEVEITRTRNNINE